MLGQVWWCIPIILALSLWQEECEFKASFDYSKTLFQNNTTSNNKNGRLARTKFLLLLEGCLLGRRIPLACRFRREDCTWVWIETKVLEV